MFRSFSQVYSCSPSMALNLFTFFSLGILKVPWDSLVSISRLWISTSLFFTWYSSSNFSPKTTQEEGHGDPQPGDGDQ